MGLVLVLSLHHLTKKERERERESWEKWRSNIYHVDGLRENESGRCCSKIRHQLPQSVVGDC